MKKKLIPSLLMLGMAGILASCGGTTSSTSSSAAGSSASSSAKLDLKADVFIYQYSDTYIGSVRTALNTDLTAKGITGTFKDAAGVQATQTQQIETAIAAGSKMLIANLVEQTATGVSVAGKAKTAKIPAIFFNREVPDAAVTSTTYPDNCFVGTDPDKAGYMQGDILAEALIKSDGTLNSDWDQNGDGKISYIMLRADESNAEANGRTTYSVQECNTKLAAKSLSPLNHLGENFNAGWSKDTAKTATDNFITAWGLPGDSGKTTPIECVIANNDDMALGAIASLATKGFNNGGTKKVLVVGVDATAAGVAAIDAGNMYGTVKQDAAAMAKCIADIAYNKLTGKDYLDGTSYTWDSETVHKIRIPYGKYTKA
jgi:methyl-galactoside transport system substrate-binding protein